ncbi:MAG: hypothetical protein IJF13_08325 [Clostridia bacterium]|nr:hypothetical protein [Clostridia bacterium]
MRRKLALFLSFLIALSFFSCRDSRDADNPDSIADTTELHTEDIAPPDSTLSSDPTDLSDPTVPSDSDTTALDVKRPMGGDDYCMVHISEYHSFPAFVTDWVINQGKDYRTWMDNALEQSADVDSDCAYSCANIYDFTEHFDIPKEIWIEYYNISPKPEYINIDLLYDGSAEDNDKYYRLTNIDEEFKAENNKWREFRELKHAVKLMSKAEGRNTSWSLVQLAHTAGVTNLSTVLPVQDFKKSSTEFIYNPDALSVLPEKSIDEIIEKYTPFYLDCLVCGVTPYNTPYERQVALNREK